MGLITLIHVLRKYKTAEEVDDIVQELTLCMDVTNLNYLSKKDIKECVKYVFETGHFINI